MENLRQKLKIFNYRPLVLVFLGLVAGVLIANFILCQTILTVVCIAIGLTVILFYSILHKTFKYAIIFSICFLLGFFGYKIYINAHTYTPISTPNKQAVGEVVSIARYDNCLNLLLTDVKVDDEALDYNVTLYYYNTEQKGYVCLEVGSVITFNIDEIKSVKYYDEENLPNTYNLSNNVGARFETVEVELIKTNTSIRKSILKRVRENLRLGLNNQNGEMVYSAMFGDKTNLNHELYDAYKASGLAHLLAVSGLHVGLVTAIIYWLLKKFKVKNWWRVAIVVILLFCYAYLCNFSHSIVRASIMAIVIMLAPLLFSEYDILSSICLAGALILIIEPIALFHVSALLSFGCVFGIAMLYPLFKKFFMATRFSNGISDAFSISLATLISTLPIMAKYFGYIQPIALISNIIILPIFSILFTITFALAMFGLILPFISYALIFINPLFEWLNWAIIVIANHSMSLITPYVNFMTILLFFCWMTFVGRYNVTKGLKRLSLISVCTCVLALQIAII